MDAYISQQERTEERERERQTYAYAGQHDEELEGEEGDGDERDRKTMHYTAAPAKEVVEREVVKEKKPVDARDWNAALLQLHEVCCVLLCML